jgi:hypothetical protein
MAKSSLVIAITYRILEGDGGGDGRLECPRRRTSSRPGKKARAPKRGPGAAVRGQFACPKATMGPRGCRAGPVCVP